MTYARVLLATDFSPESAAAAAFGLRLGPRAEVHVLHVRPMATATVFGTPTVADIQDERARTQERLRDWAKEHGAANAETHLESGSPRREVPRQAAQLHADLTVVGATGATGLKDKLLGSTARRVARESPTDVLVARGSMPDAWPRHILLATDLATPAEAAAHRVRSLLAGVGEGAKMTLVHVLDADVWRSGHDDMARAQDEAAPLLTAFNRTHLDGVATERIVEGRPDAEIARLARDLRIDLLVVGTHGAGAIERAMLGSVAEDVVERAPCTVLVVKTG